MKLNINLLILGITIAVQCQSNAVFPLTGFSTDNNSPVGVIGGSYSGDGVLQPGAVAPSGAATGSSLLVEGISSGVVTIDSMVSSRLEAATTLDFSLDLQGGTADLFVSDRTSFDGGADFFDAFVVENINGATSFMVTLDFSTLLAARNFALTDTSRGPWFGGVQLTNPGATLDRTSYQVTTELTGLVSSTDGINFTPGLDPSFSLINQSGVYDSPSAGDTVFTAGLFPTSNLWLLLKGYDTDGDGSLTAADLPNVYADTITWTISRDDGQAIPSDARFVFSFDGQVYDNLEDATQAVPEPTTYISIFLGFSLCLVRRNRN